MFSADRIRVDQALYNATSSALVKAAGVAEANIAALASNNRANLSEGNWLGGDQVSYQSVHEVCLKANENLAMAIQKAGIKINTAAGIHQSGQAQAASFYF